MFTQQLLQLIHLEENLSKPQPPHAKNRGEVTISTPFSQELRKQEIRVSQKTVA
jgi:hypothetical protein